MKLSAGQLIIVNRKIGESIEGELDGKENGESTEYALEEIETTFAQQLEHGDFISFEVIYSVAIHSEIMEEGTRFKTAETLTTITVVIENIEAFNDHGTDVIETADKMELTESLKQELTEMN